MLLLFIWILFRLHKKTQIREIFKKKHENFKFQCSTLVTIENVTCKEIYNQIIAKVIRIPFLFNHVKNYNLSEFITISNSNSLWDELTKTLQTPWKITLFQETNTKCILILQNHRNLMGGQQRIWGVINELFSNKYFPIKKTLEYSDCSYSDLIYYTQKIVKKYWSFFVNKPILNQIQKTTTSLHKYDLPKVKKICKQKHCTINDFCLAISIVKYKNFLFKNKNSIRVLMPYYFNEIYSYFIVTLYKKDIEKSFEEFIDSITYKTVLLKNNNYKYLDCFFTNQIQKFIPENMIYKLYIKNIHTIDVFMSNIKGFTIPKKLKHQNVENMCSIYHSYNRPLEIGVLSYLQNITITITQNK